MTAPLREDVAALLRTGTPYSQIRAQLHVSNTTIGATRNAIGMPPRRARHLLTPEERRTTTLKRYPQVAAMLRDGATYSQIQAAIGLSRPTISSIRRDLGIPLNPQQYPARTTTQAHALYAQPQPDGHTHWTGPHTGGGTPQLWADGRAYSTLRIAFHLHHHRHPDGPVRRGCDDPHCITGHHLTDRTIRNAHHRADQAYDAIFGPTP